MIFLKNYFKKIFGFTVLELLIVIAIIGILSSIVLASFSVVKEAAYLSRAKKEFTTFATALELYYQDFGYYPADANRDVPPGLEAYLGPGTWPDAAWPGSVFDWENWDDPDTGEKIYQISVRFCPIGQPSQCKFPNTNWAEDFDIYSSVYFCVEGACRPHLSQPVDHPGYCINC